MPLIRPGSYRISSRSKTAAAKEQKKEEHKEDEKEELGDGSETTTPPRPPLDKKEAAKQRYDTLKRKCDEHSKQVSHNQDTKQLKDFFNYFNLKTRKMAFKTARITNVALDVTSKSPKGRELQEKVHHVWDTVHQDFQTLKNAMEAAELDLTTRLAEARKVKRPRIEAVAIDPDFGCAEHFTLPEPAVSSRQASATATTATSPDRQAQLLRMAQETAAIREATKLLRKRARDFSHQRVMKHDPVNSRQSS